ncbi:hypothetical protein Tco_1193862 [Tanacetum coccineum]
MRNESPKKRKPQAKKKELNAKKRACRIEDESLTEEKFKQMKFKYFSNPLYDLDDEIITNEKFLPNQKDLDFVIPISPGIDERA